MDIKDYIMNFLVVALFITCIFSFISSFTSENKPVDSLDTSGIDLAGLESTLNSSQSNAERYYAAFSKEKKNPLIQFGELILSSTLGISYLIAQSVITIFVLIFNGIGNTLGIPPMVIGVLFSILLIGLIFAIWKSIKTGE